ncbi:HORMA domain-containing protein [Scheffersomyces coipomensis]|uniref:HORMA domain-containing protein n=1 Tax=Scheffersomyces coipomensis TaxID=1788519 RepID=UPI00315CC647
MQKSQDMLSKITEGQSKALIHNLISISLHCISFLRCIFDDDFYEDSSFIPKDKSIEGFRVSAGRTRRVKTKSLIKGSSPESDAFIDWIDQGIYQALDLKYLKTVQFSIYLDKAHPEQLIECYLLSIDYDEESIMIDSKLDGSKIQSSSSNHLNAREQVMQVIKSLIVLTQSLEPLPDQNYISIRLLYNDSCPPDYQPPLFKDDSNSMANVIFIDKARKAVDNIGTVSTGFINSNINVISAFGQDLEATIEVDPLDMDIDNDVSDTSIFSSIEIPESDHTDESDTSLHLSDLLIPKSKNVEPTQLLTEVSKSIEEPLEEVSSQNPEVLSCVSNCRSNNTISCISCKRDIIPICYGNNYYNDLKLIKCYACCFEGDIIDSDLFLLMKLRFLWDHMLQNEFPTSMQMYKLLSLKLGNASDDKIMETILNLFFQQNILIVNDKMILKPNSTEFVLGFGIFIPLTANIESRNEFLSMNEEYFVSFVPRMKFKFPFLHYKQEFAKIIFPNFATTRKEAVIKNLKKFRSCLKQQHLLVADIDDDDPIESSSQNSQYATPERSMRSNLSKLSLSPNKVCTDEIEDLSFEDSLLFLSQPQEEKGFPKKRPSEFQIHAPQPKARKISINI